MTSPASATVELDATSAVGTANPKFGAGDPFGDYQFQKPEWLRWWLHSLYMLEPADQIEVAARVLEVVHVKAARDVLESFILEVGKDLPEGGSAAQVLLQGGQVNAADSGTASASASEENQDAQAWLDRPLWQRLALVSWARYKWLVVGAGLVLLVYAWRGVVWLGQLAHTG